MSLDSSTSSVTHRSEGGGGVGGAGGGGGGVDSPSRRSLSSPWAQVVRGVGEPSETSDSSVNVAAPGSSSSPAVASEQNPDHMSAVSEPEAVQAIEQQSSDGSNGNAGSVKKSAWNKPLANGVMEGTASPVMGAASWPALGELPKQSPKLLSSSSSEASSKPISDGSVSVSQAPVISQPPQKPAKNNANSNSNSNHTHPVRQRSMKRGGGAGGASAGYNRPLPPPPPPPLPPPFPVFDMSYANMVPPVLDSPVREQPPYKGGWPTRPMGGAGSSSHAAHDNSTHRPSRRNNFGPRPRGDGVVYPNNGYGGRRDQQDRDWRGPRSPATRDVHISHQMVPPPPPPPRGYIRQPHPGPAPFIAPQPLRPYGNPIGYDMAAPFMYVPALPPEAYRGPPLVPHAAPPPMFITVMEQPPLHVLILNQIEYYFSDANLIKDNFLRSNMDEEGWVPIALIAGFPRVQSLTTDIQIILNSLRDSSAVEVQGEKVRRRNDWKKWVQSSDMYQANSSSQSPRGATNNMVAEIETLTLEKDETNKNSTLDIEGDNVKKEVGVSDIHSSMGLTDSSKLANGEINAEEASTSHI